MHITVNPQITRFVCSTTAVRCFKRFARELPKKFLILEINTILCYKPDISDPTAFLQQKTVTSYDKIFDLIKGKQHINCSSKSKLFLGTFNSLLLRAWELKVYHCEMNYVDYCVTGFVGLRGDLEAHNSP